MYKKVTAAIMAAAIVFSYLPAAGSSVFTNDFVITASADAVKDLLSSAYDAERAEVYGADGEFKIFNMSGRSYETGFTLKSGGKISFGTDGMDSLDFVVGHIDDTDLKDSNVKIQLDGKDYAEFEVKALMGLMDYHVDLNGAKIMTISLNTSRYSDQEYGFSVAGVNGEVENEYAFPAYGSNNDLLANIFDKSPNIKTTDTFSETGFKMCGMTYYQGVILPEQSGFAMNVDNVDKLSFIIGHNDDTKQREGNLNIYVDGELFQQVPLKFDMKEIKYSLDVSKANKVYLYTDVAPYSDTCYAVANIKADSLPIYKHVELPSYETAAEFVNSGFDRTEKVYVYDGTGTSTVKVNGRTYHQGISFEHNGGMTFNVQNVSKLGFDVGHVDDTALKDNAKLFIYADGEEVAQYELFAKAPVQHIDLDVTKYTNVRFVVTSAIYSGCQYMLGDITIDGKAPEKLHEVPEYISEANFIMSAFNRSKNVSVYDGQNNLCFRLNGKDEYQGVVIPSGGNVEFNTENVGKISFKLGHVDDTGSDNAAVEIYINGVLTNTYEVNADQPAKEYIVNVDKAQTLFIKVNASEWLSDKYAVADIKLDPVIDEPDTVFGDVNSDGNIDIEDAVMVINHVNGQKALTDDEVSRADIDGNSDIDIEDAVAIIAHVNGVKSIG